MVTVMVLPLLEREGILYAMREFSKYIPGTHVNNHWIVRLCYYSS